MRLPPTEIEALKRDLGRDPTPLEERMIRDAVHLKVLIEKDQRVYDRQEPLLRTIGSQKQEKIQLNPLGDRITKNLERHARILHYLDRHDPKQPEESELLKDILEL